MKNMHLLRLRCRKKGKTMEGEAYNKLNSEKNYAYAPGTYLTP